MQSYLHLEEIWVLTVIVVEKFLNVRTSNPEWNSCFHAQERHHKSQKNTLIEQKRGMFLFFHVFFNQFQTENS